MVRTFSGLKDFDTHLPAKQWDRTRWPSVARCSMSCWWPARARGAPSCKMARVRTKKLSTQYIWHQPVLSVCKSCAIYLFCPIAILRSFWCRQSGSRQHLGRRGRGRREEQGPQQAQALQETLAQRGRVLDLPCLQPLHTSFS